MRQTSDPLGTNTRVTSLGDYSEQHSEVAFIVFISTFIILSFLSNVCVVVIMMTIKTMRTVTNMFLTNLAISDMILVSVILPLQVFDITHTDEYDECKLHVACPVFCCIVKPHENKSPKNISETVMELNGFTPKSI